LTEQNQSIVTLLAQVMADLKVLPKGEQFSARGMESYRFRGVDATINAVGPLFRKYGIVGPVPHVDDVRYETVPIGADKRPTGFARVIVTYRFFGPAGDELPCTVPGEAMDRGDKAIAKAMSVALRIALLQMLCLPTDEEADPDSVNYERSLPERPRNGNGRRNAPAPVPDAPPDPADIARELLLAKIDKLGLNAREVAVMYSVDTGRDIATDTNAEAITSFTERLEPSK
jgi:hypothetical protein